MITNLGIFETILWWTYKVLIKKRVDGNVQKMTDSLYIINTIHINRMYIDFIA